MSEDGTLLKRHYNGITRAWEWDARGPLEYIEDDEGRLGYRYECTFREIHTLIALASPGEREPAPEVAAGRHGDAAA